MGGRTTLRIGIQVLQSMEAHVLTVHMKAVYDPTPPVCSPVDSSSTSIAVQHSMRFGPARQLTMLNGLRTTPGNSLVT